MKGTELTKAIDKVVSIKMELVDRFVSEFIEPIADIGNPEKLINKAYESWTPEELSAMIQIYGTKEPNPLSDLVFRKKYEEVKALEGEEI